MKQHSTNGWFHASEFPRACEVIHRVATQEHTRWLNHPGTKYVQLRIDQRTGDFMILNQIGDIIQSDVVYSIFPELKD